MHCSAMSATHIECTVWSPPICRVKSPRPRIGAVAPVTVIRSHNGDFAACVDVNPALSSTNGSINHQISSQMYTLETSEACVPVPPCEDDASHGVAAGLDGVAAELVGSPSPCLQSCRRWPQWWHFQQIVLHLLPVAVGGLLWGIATPCCSRHPWMAFGRSSTRWGLSLEFLLVSCPLQALSFGSLHSSIDWLVGRSPAPLQQGALHVGFLGDSAESSTSCLYLVKSQQTSSLGTGRGSRMDERNLTSRVQTLSSILSYLAIHRSKVSLFLFALLSALQL